MTWQDEAELRFKQAESQAYCDMVYQIHLKKWTDMHSKSQDYPQAVTELVNEIRKFYDIDSRLFLNTIILAALKRCRNDALEEAANLIGGLAERPSDSEPEFNAILVAESLIRNLKEAE